MTRSMAAIGRSFRFSLDMELSPTPMLNNENNSTVFQYLRGMSTDSTFSLSILNILIEERITEHHKHHDKGETRCTLTVDDVLIAHIQVQSRVDTGLVGKVSYRARGPFIITKYLGNNSFEAQ